MAIQLRGKGEIMIHTPKHWKCVGFGTVVNEHGHKLAHLRFGKGIGTSMRIPLEEVHGNARLIASAPELLEFLTDFVKDLAVDFEEDDHEISGADTVDWVANRYERAKMLLQQVEE